MWIRGTRKWRNGPKTLMSRLYKNWNRMRDRCRNPSLHNYHGGRGIRVCKEWEDFAVFREWAISNGFRKGLTIERIDNDGDYCPENCKWIEPAKQAANKSTESAITKGSLAHAKTNRVLSWFILDRRA